METSGSANGAQRGSKCHFEHGPTSARDQSVAVASRSAVEPGVAGECAGRASGDEGGSETPMGAGQIGEERTVAVSDIGVSRASASRAASPAKWRISLSASRESLDLRSAAAQRTMRRLTPIRSAVECRVANMPTLKKSVF